MTMKKSGRTELGRREAIGLLGLGAGLATLRQEISAAAPLALPAAQGAGIPSDTIIRTVLKDVSPDALREGATLMHEHVVGGFYSSPPRQAAEGDQRGRRLGPEEEDLDLIVDELMASKRDGLTGIVDAAIGRRPAQSIENLKTISARSGVHIIVAGGYFHAPYPAAVMSKGEDQIAEQFYQDAQAQRWGAFGEIGSSTEIHPDEQKMIRAVSKAHLRTGLPIFTHIPHDSCHKCALEQLDLYESQNVNPRHLCIGHLSDLKDDPKGQTAIAIAERGAFLGFDTVGHEISASRTTLVTDRIKLQMVLAVLEAGYEDLLPALVRYGAQQPSQGELG